METDNKNEINVPPEGPQDARVMLIGQNPGREEIKQGRPFVGRAGKYLDEVLKKNGIDRSSIYITSVVKKGTPKNRKPTSQEISQGIPGLVAEIKRIKPDIIVLMGAVAWQTPNLEGIEYIQTYHPAAAMRFPRIRKKFEEDFKIISERIRRLC